MKKSLKGEGAVKVKDIAEIIEKSFPLNLAFERDNVGLLVGDKEAEISKILITCDVNEDVVKEAVSVGANLIISHHPLMFFKTSRLTESDAEQRAIRSMIKNGISLYSAHTNLDAANGGLNDYMASLLGMTDTSIIDVTSDDSINLHGFGRMGVLKETVTLKELMNKVIKVFDADGLRYAGDLQKKVTKVAVNTGGGADILPLAAEYGCDVVITGDIKYNGYLDALTEGMCVIDIMHYDSEHIVMDFFEKFLSDKTCGISILKSKSNVNLIKTYTL